MILEQVSFDRKSFSLVMEFLLDFQNISCVGNLRLILDALFKT